MNIKYESLKRLNGERNSSYNKRKCYILAGPNRSLDDVARDEMGVDVSKHDKKYKRAISSLENLKSRYDWDMWADLYDIEIETERMKEKTEKFTKLEDIEMNMLEALIKSLHNFIAEFVKSPTKKDGEEYSSMSKVDLYNKILAAFDKADLILRRLTGQPTDYTKVDTKNSVDLKASFFDGKSLKEKEERDNEIIEQFITRKLKELERASETVEENGSE